MYICTQNVEFLKMLSPEFLGGQTPDMDSSLGQLLLPLQVTMVGLYTNYIQFSWAAIVTVTGNHGRIVYQLCTYSSHGQLLLQLKVTMVGLYSNYIQFSWAAIVTVTGNHGRIVYQLCTYSSHGQLLLQLQVTMGGLYQLCVVPMGSYCYIYR